MIIFITLQHNNTQCKYMFLTIDCLTQKDSTKVLSQIVVLGQRGGDWLINETTLSSAIC